MIWRTHLAITVFAILIFIPNISYPLIFSIVALFASLVVDIDSYCSLIGNKKIARPLQFFTQHRGIIHSLTFAIVLSLIISFFSPKIALPFFVGYGIHVFVDAFTVDGVQPFWPYKAESRGLLKTGRHSEAVLFLFFVLLDLFMAYLVFFG